MQLRETPVCLLRWPSRAVNDDRLTSGRLRRSPHSAQHLVRPARAVILGPVLSVQPPTFWLRASGDTCSPLVQPNWQQPGGVRGESSSSAPKLLRQICACLSSLRLFRVRDSSPARPHATPREGRLKGLALRLGYRGTIWPTLRIDSLRLRRSGRMTITSYIRRPSG